ncbi:MULTISPECIES: PolC-type DNA polymerase III [unclassified Nocardiopsis]|uniref:3'-5' exonuclease n=1 Tax=unclassified Nocardiopsis TaxID=2649073 RepID=UPI00066D37A9|nr:MULTISPECIES: 3'-5' exonuclease [unclassified Nocardiopsis]MBQ1082719.1 3'-5' exonuclease [Nocardiopsis sp. B62]
MGTLRTGALTRRRVGMRAADLEYAVLDVETTGLDPREGARLVEIAVVRVRGDGTLVEEFSTLVDPRAPVSGQEFHGIGEGDVIGAPRAESIVPRIAQLLSGAVVVCHNLDFEERFLSSELVPAGLPRGLSGLCTLRALRSQLDLPRYSLPRATHLLSGEWPTGQHTALGDARACARLLVEMIANAPGELRYTGPEPRLLRVDVSPDEDALLEEPVRWKPRTTPLPGGLDPLNTWNARWRGSELDAALCGGAFRATERVVAESAARRGSRLRSRVAAVAAVTGGIAATVAGGLLVRMAGGRGGPGGRSN